MDAVKKIEDLGGVAFGGDQVGPKWLRALVGYRGMVVLAGVESACFFPDEKTFTRRHRGTLFPTLRYTEGRSVDDLSLSWVRDSPKLKSLYLQWTNIGDGTGSALSTGRPVTY